MKRWPLALLLIFLTGNCSHAEDKAREQANMILLKASDLETFKVGELPKYRLEVHFSFLRPGIAETKGTFIMEYDSAPLWHEELEFGGFRYHKVRIRKQTWTRANNDFIPITVQGLWEALYATSFRLTESNVVKRVHDRKIDGVEGQCVEFETVRGNDKEEEQICVQKDSGFVINRRYGTREISYSDYSPFGAKVRPRRITIDFGGMDKIVADVNYRVVETFDPVGFEPIVDGEVADVCFTSRPPIAKYSPDPVYPLTVRRGSYKGKVIVDVKVGPDGSVLSAAIAETLQSDLDTAALGAVKKWKFEPGTCNGNAVKSVTQVTATYR